MKSGNFRLVQLMTRYLLIFVASLMSSSCFAVGSSSGEKTCSDLSLDNLYARYVIYDVVRYRGGLTSEAAAKARIGKSVLVGQTDFMIREISIPEPFYELTCYASPKEGSVDANRWSNFYGHGVGRERINVLHVYTDGDKGEDPFVNLEVLDDELWELHDGWLYMMKPAEERE